MVAIQCLCKTKAKRLLKEPERESLLSAVCVMWNALKKSKWSKAKQRDFWDTERLIKATNGGDFTLELEVLLFYLFCVIAPWESQAHRPWSV